MDEREETGSELAIASSNTTILLEFLEQTFDQVSFLIEMPIIRPWVFVRFGRDAKPGARSGDKCPDRLGAVSLVSNYDRPLQRYGRQRWLRFLGIVDVASC